jgi:competence protein ComEC
MLVIYYEFPIYSFLLNLIIIPAMTIVMLLGVGCLLVGIVPVIFFMGIAKFVGLACSFMLGIFEFLCRESLKLAGSNWIVGRPDTFRIVIYITVVIYLYLAHNYGVRMSKKEACISSGVNIMLPVNLRLIIILLAVVFISGKTPPESSINFIDVGQGDGIYVESKEGASFLIDGGSSSNSDIAKYTLVPYLKYNGVSRLDAVFLTHLDSDHISGVMDMLSLEDELDYNIEIGQICISESVIEDETYDKLVKLCNNKNVPLLRLKAGDEIGYGDVKFKILHPSSSYVPDSKNAYSLVMKLEVGGVSALLTGDVSEDGERLVSTKLGGGVDIYKASHHGSKYSNTIGIINAALPNITVISCGEGNSYGHPHSEAVDNFKSVGSDILVTKDTGAIMFKINQEKFSVETYIKE